MSAQPWPRAKWGAPQQQVYELTELEQELLAALEALYDNRTDQTMAKARAVMNKAREMKS